MLRERLWSPTTPGLEVDALNGAPGVHSARYAADEPHLADANTDDEANNARVLRELNEVPPEKRTGRFVCVLAAARDGKTAETFRGIAEGIILDAPRGTNGFGYDPLFYFPQDPEDIRGALSPRKNRNTAIAAQRSDSFLSGVRSEFPTAKSKQSVTNPTPLLD